MQFARVVSGQSRTPRGRPAWLVSGPSRKNPGGSRSPLPAPRTPGWAPASHVLYDCSTPYFETDQGGGFRESGFSKERRLEPQITIGLSPARLGSRSW